MARVTVYYVNGNETSFETTDRATIRRYENYALTDPEISSVSVTD